MPRPSLPVLVLLPLLTTCGHSPAEPPAGMGRLIVRCCQVVGGTPEAPDCRPNRVLDGATAVRFGYR